jgi:MoxR-like ATPase
MNSPAANHTSPLSTPRNDLLPPARRQLIERIITAAGAVILGKERSLRLALACLVARGHLLIEDLPGVGKTTLAQVLARVLGLQFRRIQFTSDLLPADILGTSVYDREQETFRFHPGPVFAQLVLADEVNRATPKTQSALLEAMEENQVTAEGRTCALPEPFFVVATQNPSHQVGTFSLPESQLDRFLMRIEMGYPDAAAERRLLKGRERRDLLQSLAPVTDAAGLIALQDAAAAVHVSDALVDYVQALLHFSRTAPGYRHGLSPRAGIALVRAARAWALVAGRGFVIPEDVQTVLPAVAVHRLQAAEGGEASVADLLQQLGRVAVP